MADETSTGDRSESPAAGVDRERIARAFGATLLLVTVVALAVGATAPGAAAAASTAATEPAAATHDADLDAAPSPAAVDGANPNFTIASASANASSVGVGEAVGVTVELRNDGTERSHYTARLTADGEYVTGVRARIEAGETRTVRLVARFDRPGTYQLAVDGRAVGNVTATAPDSVRLTNASIDREHVELQEPMNVTGRLVNDGDWPTTRTVTLAVEGEAVANRTIRLDPGERTVVTFEHSFDRPGEHTFDIDGQRAGTVMATGDGVSTPSRDRDLGVFGLAIGGLVVLVVVGAAYAWVQAAPDDPGGPVGTPEDSDGGEGGNGADDGGNDGYGGGGNGGSEEGDGGGSDDGDDGAPSADRGTDPESGGADPAPPAGAGTPDDERDPASTLTEHVETDDRSGDDSERSPRE